MLTAMTERVKCSRCGAEWTAETLDQTGLCIACIERQERESKRDLANYGLPVAYRSKTEYRDKGVIAALLKAATSENGIYIYGKCGVGKTHLMALVYKSILSADKVWLPAPELFLEIRETFDKGALVTEREVLEKYCRAEWLFIDDFAAEKISDFTRETIYLLLDRRIRAGKLKVYFTSNHSPKEVGKILSDRVASRIGEICGKNIIQIAGDDYRLKKTSVVSYAEKSLPKETDDAPF